MDHVLFVSQAQADNAEEGSGINKEGWYFYDEDGLMYYGPYKTQERASVDSVKYGEWLNRGDELADELMDDLDMH